MKRTLFTTGMIGLLLLSGCGSPNAENHEVNSNHTATNVSNATAAHSRNNAISNSSNTDTGNWAQQQVEKSMNQAGISTDNSGPAAVPDISGNWSIKDITDPGTGTMTLVEGPDHSTLQGSMNMMGTEIILTGFINMRGAISLQGNGKGGSASFNGSLITPTEMKLSVVSTSQSTPDQLVITKSGK